MENDNIKGKKVTGATEKTAFVAPSNPSSAVAPPSPSSSSSSSFSTFLTPSASGINAVQINNAREMFLMSTRSRNNPAAIRGSKTKISLSSPSATTATSEINETVFQTSLPSSMMTISPFTNPNISVPAKSHEGGCKNPQCTCCGSVIIPSPASSLPVKDSPSISINDWEIFTTRKPILNAEEIDHYEEKLNLPLPEMIFGKNEVRVKNTKHNWEIVFNSIDSLDTVLKIGCDPNKLLKVAHSKDWFSHKQKKASGGSSPSTSSTSSSLGSTSNNNNASIQLSSDMYDTEVPTDSLNEHVTKMIKPYDWTYTPHYKGTPSPSNSHKFTRSQNQIPIKKLKRPDPILFFDDVVLYEDELADNGIAVMQCKIRVMEKRLLLLCRFFLRIDDVIFRIKDVRLFVEFEENLVIRDIKEQEDTYRNVYNKVLRLGGGGDPRFYLRDSNWVSNHLTTVYHEVEEIKF